MQVKIPLCINPDDGHEVLREQLGIYNLWDEKVFVDQTAEDLMWFFRVNVVVGQGCLF